MPKKERGYKFDYSEMRRLYEEGLGTSEIAKRMGACKATIYEHLRDFGITRTVAQANKLRSKFSAKEMEDLYSDGHGCTEIAQNLGCDESLVTYHLRKLGYNPRKELKKNGKYKGSNASQWAGGRHKATSGYVEVYQPNHRLASSRGYVWEHRLVWEASTGKQLPEWWVVHHLNGIKDDNRPENLIAMSKSAHFATQGVEPLRARIRELESKIKQLEEALILVKGETI